MTEARAGTSTQGLEIVTSDDIVTPWRVESKSENGITYEKLIERFRTIKVDNKLLFQFERVTHKIPHYFLRRRIFFCHRDMHKILDLYQQGQSFYLYVTISPSSNGLHLGHLIPLIFSKWLQEAFDIPLIIQLSDDKKLIWENINEDDITGLVHETTKDIIACGFNPNKTFIFSSVDHIGNNPAFYLNTVKIQKHVAIGQMKGIFKFEDSDSVGKIAFPATCCAPTLSSTFPFIFRDKKIPCVFPCAISQDLYFQMMRDVAPKLHHPKPALLHSIFLPALHSLRNKMSSNDYNSAIFLKDDISTIEDKINKYSSFNKEYHCMVKNYNTNFCYQWLNVFLVDDKKLQAIQRACTLGYVFGRDLKGILINVLKEVIIDHQRNKNRITEDLIKQLTTPRDLGFASSKS